MKSTHFIGSSLADLKTFPADVRSDVGFALNQAEHGEKSLHATPLLGFKSAGVLEIISNSDGNTYRAVYTVRLSEAVFVLHCFQKKSKTGVTNTRKAHGYGPQPPQICRAHQRGIGASPQTGEPR